MISALDADLVVIDSRSSVSNIVVPDAVEAALAGFDIERLDDTDAAGTPKRARVAHRGKSAAQRMRGYASRRSRSPKERRQR